MTDAQPSSNEDTNQGNFKGILLSNRPQNAFHVTNNFYSATKAVGSTTIPFMPSGKVKDLELGLPPNREQLQNNAAAKKSLLQKQKSSPFTNVTYQHKQYIKQLQEEKQKEKLDSIEKELKSEEVKVKLNESRKKLKDIMKEANYSDTEIHGFLKSGKVESKVVKDDELEKSPKTRPKSKKAPAWLTQRPDKQVNTKTEEPMDEELDDLLDFANSLNYDNYIEDFEVREALAVIHSRVKELEDEVKKEEKEELEISKQNRIEEARQRGAEARLNIPTTPNVQSRLHHEKDWDNSIRFNDQDISSQYDTTLSKDKSLKQIHSNASIINATRHAIFSRGSGDVGQQSLTAEEAGKEIERLMETIHRENAKNSVVVTHNQLSMKGNPDSVTEIVAHVTPNTEGERILLKLKKDPNYVQNLPYMYRCPSI